MCVSGVQLVFKWFSNRCLNANIGCSLRYQLVVLAQVPVLFLHLCRRCLRLMVFISFQPRLHQFSLYCVWNYLSFSLYTSTPQQVLSGSFYPKTTSETTGSWGVQVCLAAVCQIRRRWFGEFPVRGEVAFRS